MAILIAIGWDILSRSPLVRYPSPPQSPTLEPLRAIVTIPMPDMVVSSAAFSPDGKRLVAAGRTNTELTKSYALVWACDLEKPESAWHFQETDDRGCYDCTTYSPDMRSVAVGGSILSRHEAQVRVLDVATGKLRWSSSLKWGVSCLAWSPDGSRLAAGNHYDGTVTVWDSDGKNERIAWKPSSIGEGGTVWHLAWSHDGKRIVSTSSGVIHLWEVESGHEIAIVEEEPYSRKLKAAKGRVVAAVSNEGIHYWPRLAFTPDDRSVLVTGRMLGDLTKNYAADVWVWDLESNRESRSLVRSSRTISGVVLTKDRRHLVTLSGLTEEERIKHPEFAFVVHGWDYSNGRRLWARTAILDPEKGSSRFPYAISPDGRRAAMVWTSLASEENPTKVTVFELPQLP